MTPNARKAQSTWKSFVYGEMDKIIKKEPTRLIFMGW